MPAEIVSIGTELVSGQSLDTNSRWLAGELASAGIDTGWHSTIGDDFDVNVAAFRTALARAEFIVVTGGLGPTRDDLTREVLAALAGVPLELHEDSLRRIEAMFRLRNRPFPERNRVQALFPVGAEPIPNERGTAPGIWFEVGGKPIVCMPGVPVEMKGMWAASVLPRLKERFGGGRCIVFRILKTFGEGESHIEQQLGDLIRRGRTPEVGITASEATISLRIKGEGPTPEAAWASTEPDASFIRATLGDLVYGEGEAELHEVVGRLLIERGKSLSTAESCTGGLLGKLMTDLPGISSVYPGGVVSYANAAKSDLLGVDPAILERHGAVSPETAAAMAEGCRRRFGTDFALSITGIAGPDGGTKEKPVGLVHVALAGPEGTDVGRYNWPAERPAIRIRAAKTALNLLRRKLLAGG